MSTFSIAHTVCSRVGAIGPPSILSLTYMSTPRRPSLPSARKRKLSRRSPPLKREEEEEELRSPVKRRRVVQEKPKRATYGVPRSPSSSEMEAQPTTITPAASIPAVSVPAPVEEIVTTTQPTELPTKKAPLVISSSSSSLSDSSDEEEVKTATFTMNAPDPAGMFLCSLAPNDSTR